MRYRKMVLYILLMVLGLILAYNYLVSPSVMQNTGEMGMGMGMHWGAYTSSNYIIDARVILVIAIIIAVLLIFELVKPKSKQNICSKCGKEIENEKWKICPICGNPLDNRKG